jgi:UDP-GlcNAc:undecaprenyl-phosphate GlcNAc-1-phosphate transferase
VAKYALSFGLAFAISLALTFVVRGLARRFGLVAKPRADRWHKKPTALYGGVGMFAALLLAYAFLPLEHVPGTRLLLLCMSAMFLLGLVDDAVQLKPYTKLIGQIVVATAFTMFGLRLHWIPSPPIDQALTIFWMVGITNALNLLDSLDGVAGGIAAIASAFMVYFCHVGGQPAMAALAAAFSGAVAGFLVFNFNPASIFMGDCGSLFLGFFLGGAALVNNQYGMRRNVVSILAIPVLLLLIPIVDTTLVTVSRKLNGRKVSQGGRDHTSHRLVALGMSERAAALTLWGLAALAGTIAVLVRNLSWVIGAFVVPAFALLLVFFIVFVGRVRVYEPVVDERAISGRALLPTLADFTYKRRIFEVLNDLVVTVLAFYGAFLLRWDGARIEPYYSQMLLALPLATIAQLSVFLVSGLYKGLWRYTSMADVSTLLRSVIGGWVASMLVLFFVFRFESMSRGMLLINAVLLFGGIAGSRILLRLIRNWAMRFQPRPEAKRVLIYGAGDGGELLLRELLNNHDLAMLPVGFVDDDPQKHGRMIHGVSVLGSLDRIADYVEAKQVDAILVSTTKLAEPRLALLDQACKKAGVPCRRLRIALE